MARYMIEIQDRMINRVNKEEVSFAETYTLNRGIKVFGRKGYEAAYNEVNQLHKRKCFSPIDVKTLKGEERKKALESLIFLTAKRDSQVKGHACANRNK